MTLRSLLSLLAGLCALPLFPSCIALQAGGRSSSHPLANIGPVYPGVASYVVADANDGRVLLSFQPDQKRPVASLTKIATAVVVLDYLRGSPANIDEIMVVPPSVLGLGVPSPLGLQPGDGLSVRDALCAAMMASDNFAAETLGTHFGAKLSAVGLGGTPLSAFVSQMNGLSARLSLRQTQFANPHGLDLPGASGYSCASDVARLLNHAITIPGFTFYSSQASRRITFLRNGTSQTISVRNTNEIIGQNRIDAGKTGTTLLAGPCLAITAPKPATVIKRPDGSTLVIPHRLTVVALGAPDRFTASSRLLAEGWKRYENWRAVNSPPGQPFEYLGALPAPLPPALPAPPQPAPAPALPQPPAFPPTSGGYQPLPY